jgi:hypothetical protein
MQSPSPWSTRILPGFKRLHVELLHDGAVVRHAIVTTPGAATTKASAWAAEARAGCVQPFPLDYGQHRLAAAPLRASAPQELDTGALPLFGDQRAQLDLVDLLR